MSEVQRLYQLDKSFAPELDRLLHDEEYVGRLLQLPENELISLVNYLNDTINRFTHIGVPSRKCLHVLRKICGARKVIPAAYDVSGTLSVSSKNAFAHGGFCDAYRGTLSTEVCIKKVRVYSSGDQDAIKELSCKEAVVWKRLDHPNVVAFKGITLNPLQLVSEWIPGGELREYIKKNPDANRINLLIGVAEGLAYLHSCDVIHGDLKGPNIVVDGSENARIVDFGLTSIIRDPNSVASTSDGHGYTPWWTAPEIFRDGISTNKKSDVFSFAMIIYEVFSGKVPFHDVPAPAVPASVMCGKRPKRPDHAKLTDLLWELTERCWAERAQDRPEMKEVIEALKEINAGKIAQVKKRPSAKRTPSDRGTPQKKSEDGGGYMVIPYDVGASPPVQTLSPPPKAGGNERPTHKIMQVVGSRTTNESSLRPSPSTGNSDPPVASSTAGIMIERELLKNRDARESQEKDATGLKETDVMGFKGKDAEGLEEKPEGKGRKGVGRWNQGKATEQAIKMGKDEKVPKPEIPLPLPTLPAPSKAGGNGRPTHKVVQAVGGGTTNEPSLWPLPSAGNSNPSAVSFTTGVVIEHEPLKEEKDAKEFKETDVMGLKGKDAEALKEKPEGKGRNGVGRGNQGKEPEQAIKTGKGENAPEPAGSITTFSGLDLDEDAMPMFYPLAEPQVNQSGNQTPKLPEVQPRAHKPADIPRNRDKSAGQGQGTTADTHAATLQLPASTASRQRTRGKSRSFFCCC